VLRLDELALDSSGVRSKKNPRGCPSLGLLPPDIGGVWILVASYSMEVSHVRPFNGRNISTLLHQSFIRGWRHATY
jgi:hypothetical protein